jgi:hypothetical protein
MTVTESIADKLLATGQATRIGDSDTTLADGTHRKVRTISINTVTIGGHGISNVPAMVNPDGAIMLLGFAVLNKVSDRFAINTAKSTLDFDIQASAQESPSKLEPDQVLPLLQDGSARGAFVSGTYAPCLKKQRGAPENAGLTTPELGDFCLCYGRALADQINSREFQDLDVTGVEPIPASLVKKTNAAAYVCQRRMRADQQSTVRERDVVAVTQECLKAYHPEDTDYAAAEVHNRFCTCLAPEWVDLVANDKQLGAADISGRATAIKQRCEKRLLE